MPRKKRNLKTKIIWITTFFSITYLLLTFFTPDIADLLPSEKATQETTSIIHEPSHQPITVTFCPHQNCEQPLLEVITSATSSLHCAFYDLDLENIKAELIEKSKLIDVQVVIDEDNAKEFNESFATVNDASGLMHHKFCIADGKVITTGSFNPTDRGAHHNNNNLVVLHSEFIAENYEKEFQEALANQKRGNTSTNTHIRLGDTLIENYFCPDDDCADQVITAIKNAKSSINFMTFSFTHDNIAMQLVKKKQEGLEVRGIMEARQVSQYSQYDFLRFQDIEVYKDANPANMHHKVFIIDNETVITGSFNPSKNGDRRNDENVIILHDAEVAGFFVEEFERLFMLINETASSPMS